MGTATDINNIDFEELVMQSDVRHFLKASPVETGMRSSMDCALTEEYYFDHIYAHTQEADKIIESIEEKAAKEDMHNFILSGYKGCGKSTFVRYFLRSRNLRNLTINIDKNVEPDIGIIHNMAAFINGMIEADLQPEDGGEPCCVTKMYVDLFCRNAGNRRQINEFDTRNYFFEFGRKMEFLLFCKDSNDLDKMMDCFVERVKKQTIEGTISEVLMLIVLWDTAARIVNNQSAKCCIIFENLDIIYNTQEVPKLVRNVLAFRNNIDQLVTSLTYQGESIGNPSQNYMLFFVMRETTTAEFSSYIDHFSDGKIPFEPITEISGAYDIYSIIAKRKECLDYIASKHPEYSENAQFKSIAETCNLIKTLLTDNHMKKRLFGLFNNDYRTCVEVLTSFHVNDSKFFRACEKLLTLAEKDEDDWSAFGYRALVFREVFDVFVKEGYINRLRNFEYSLTNDGTVRSINLDRMILLYLSNHVTNKEVPEDEKDFQFVSLKELFIEMKKFCSKSDSIVEAIWQMYDLRTTQKWNHLVTFDDMQMITLEELKREMSSLENNEEASYAKIKITLAGETYLNHMLPSFEFYGARAECGNEYSLFAFSAEELCDFRRINSILRKQIREIKDCCQRLYAFFQEVFTKLPDLNEKNYLKSDFASYKYSTNRESGSAMYHCERIVHSNIGYLNRLRYYSFYMMDEAFDNGGFDKNVDIAPLLLYLTRDKKYSNNVMKLWPADFSLNKIEHCFVLKRDGSMTGKQEIMVERKNGSRYMMQMDLQAVCTTIKACLNDRFIQAIRSFIALFAIGGGKQYAMCSGNSERLCEAFEACITYKIQKSGYLDFETPVDAVTGRNILKDRNIQSKKEREQRRHGKTIE